MKSTVCVRAHNEYLEVSGLPRGNGSTARMFYTLAEGLEWAREAAREHELELAAADARVTAVELELPGTEHLIVALLEQAASPDCHDQLTVARELLALPVCDTWRGDDADDLLDTVVDAAKVVLGVVGVDRKAPHWRHMLNGCSVQAARVKAVWRIR
jgi:hypothetical protein